MLCFLIRGIYLCRCDRIAPAAGKIRVDRAHALAIDQDIEVAAFAIDRCQIQDAKIAEAKRNGKSAGAFSDSKILRSRLS